MTQSGDGGAGDVAAYYDRNTSRFLRFGRAGDRFAIHRQLWDGHVTTSREAAEHLDTLLGNAVCALGTSAPRVLDLGCGVGGTLFALAARLATSRLVGVTISPFQHALAERLSVANGTASRIEFLCGDFEHTNLDLEADVILAVEAFAHSRSAHAFFSNAARHLAPGGALIVVDDFLAIARDDLGDAARRNADRFERGWRLGSFDTVDAAVETASRAGLACTERRDLTALIRLDEPSRRFIAGLSPALARLGLTRLPFFGNLIGGGALHRGIAADEFTYRWLRFAHADAVSTRLD